MSRSKGAGGLADLIKRQGGERIRFFLLRTHYRSTVLFNEPAIEEAGVGLETFYRLFKRYTRVTGKDFYALKPPKTREAGAIDAGNDPALQAAADCREKFIAAMDDDFNTGGAIGELFELAKITNKFCDDADLEGKGKSDAAAIAKFTKLLTTFGGVFQHPGHLHSAGRRGRGCRRFAGQSHAAGDRAAWQRAEEQELRRGGQDSRRAGADRHHAGRPGGRHRMDSGGGAQRHGRHHEAIDSTACRLASRKRFCHRRRHPQPPRGHRRCT